MLTSSSFVSSSASGHDALTSSCVGGHDALTSSCVGDHNAAAASCVVGHASAADSSVSGLDPATDNRSSQTGNVAANPTQLVGTTNPTELSLDSANTANSAGPAAAAAQVELIRIPRQREMTGNSSSGAGKHGEACQAAENQEDAGQKQKVEGMLNTMMLKHGKKE